MNKNINETIFELIKRQFVKLMQNDYDYYKDYNIVLSNEQQFVDSEKREPNKIYIVVKFLPSSLLFGQYTQNITIDAVSEQNGIEVCKTLMNEYALNYNLEATESVIVKKDKPTTYTIKQVYTTPMVASNFNEVFYGYRSLFSMSGTFIVSDKSNSFSLWYGNEEIECITSAWDLTITPSTQPYFDSKNFTRSIGQYGTLAINFTTYLTTTPLLNKCLAIALKDTNLAVDGVNETFNFDIKFKNGMELKNAPFKLIHFATQQNIGEIPVVSLSFTN